MTTIAIIGAGRGLGAAVARRFGRAGFAVALVSRSSENAQALAEDLTGDGITAAGYAADVRDPDALAAALAAAARDLGPIEVLQYSPVPPKPFLQPVLQTSREDLREALEFSVLGPITAVHQVLPGMRDLGRGTLLFVNGGSAARPNSGYAGTSVAFAAESAYAQVLHEALAGEGIHAAQLIIPGSIDPDDEHKSPDALAQRLWELHTVRDGFRTFATPMDT